MDKDRGGMAFCAGVFAIIAGWFTYEALKEDGENYDMNEWDDGWDWEEEWDIDWDDVMDDVMDDFIDWDSESGGTFDADGNNADWDEDTEWWEGED